MSVLVQQYIQAYFIPVMTLLMVACTALRFSGMKSLARTGFVIIGVMFLVMAVFGGYGNKHSIGLASAGIFTVLAFSFFLYVDPESRRRR